jgi:hypothetical protein
VNPTTERAIRLACRVMAITIAIAGVADPVVSVSRPQPTRVTIATAVEPLREGEARRARETLIAAAGRNIDWIERTSPAGRLPCAGGDPCVVIADGSVNWAVPPDRTELTSVIRLGLPGAPNTSISSASVASNQHVAAAGVIEVDVAGVGVAGQHSDVLVRDGDAIVGSTSIDWKTDGTQRIAIPWWPIAEGARRLRLSLGLVPDEPSGADNVVDLGATVSAARLPVLVFEPRPSWASAFVRRALEGDPRLSVEGRVTLGPTMWSGTPSSRLDQRVLDRSALVVVGAPEALDTGEVALLDRYVRVRGGTLALVPDRAPAGPVLTLLRGGWREQLRSAPEPVGPLQASELLIGENASDLDIVLGGSADAPTLMVRPVGAGRILVSGAMDAWRYRTANDNAFDRFWRSIAADAARNSASLTLDLGVPVATRAARVPIIVRFRSMIDAAIVNVRAYSRCGGDEAVPIRLWPAGESGVFTGSFTASSAPDCVIEAAIEDGPSASTAVVVADDVRRSVIGVLGDLDRLVKATGGLNVEAGEAARLASALVDAMPPVPAVTAIRSMHSLWWMFPFAALLGSEWWLRRRGGLR